MASEKILKAKQEQVEALSAKLNKAVAGVVVDYRGITVADDTIPELSRRGAGMRSGLQVRQGVSPAVVRCLRHRS